MGVSGDIIFNQLLSEEGNKSKYNCCCLPDIGAEFYKACLAFHTSTDLSAQQIHQRGLQEVERIEEEMRDIVKEMGYNVTLQEFIQILR